MQIAIQNRNLQRPGVDLFSNRWHRRKLAGMDGAMTMHSWCAARPTGETGYNSRKPNIPVSCNIIRACDWMINPHPVYVAASAATRLTYQFPEHVLSVPGYR